MSPRPALPQRLEYVILGLVRRQPTHGYELLRIWNQPHAIGEVWRVKPGPLYAALEKLEQVGYLQARLIAGDVSPTRKEFHITLDGEQSFVTWMKTPVSAARDFRQDFLAKLYFSADVDRAVIIELFERQRELCQRWLSSLQQQMKDNNQFRQQVISFRFRQVQCICEWLNEVYVTFK